MSMESAAATAGLPRLVVAGLSGESGKTLVSLALLLEAGRRGIPARAFKKGPDYIDSAWLEWASGTSCPQSGSLPDGVRARRRESFARHAVPGGCNVIEGNRGLYDGADARGTHSTAELAKALRAPVVLVVNATKMTRTAAALVLGCRHLDPEVEIAGVVVNQVSGARHERILREAIESACGVPVLGAIPRAKVDVLLPSRHLGLVTPHEHPDPALLARQLMQAVGPYLDFDRLFAISRGAAPLAVPHVDAPVQTDGSGLKIGYLSDSAFCFYYPENLEALRATGAGLIAISSLAAPQLPAGLDALYIGGGFPETHAAALSANSGLLASIREAARQGLPIYAECGGLMYSIARLDLAGTPLSHGRRPAVRSGSVRFSAGARICGTAGGPAQRVLRAGHPAARPRIPLFADLRALQPAGYRLCGIARNRLLPGPRCSRNR